MGPTLWIGLIATIAALAIATNAVRLVRAGSGHVANAARLHIVIVAVFVPLLWLTLVVIQL